MSTATKAEDRLYRTVAGVLGVSPEELSDASSPQTIESWDSLNHLNLVMALESEYGISLSPEEALDLRNVGAIRAILGESPVEAEEMPITFVDCREEHVTALQAFAARSYHSQYVLAANAAYFRWQFGNMAGGPVDRYHMKLAMADGQILGCLGCFPVEFNLDGRLLRGCWLANWMVDQQQRRFGIGPLLVREVAQHYDIVLALGPNRDARDILSRMGWADFGLLARYVSILDATRAGLLTATGNLQWPAEALAAAAKACGTVGVERIARFNDDAAQLWDRTWAARAAAAGTRRSAAFLNWRYADHPQFEYRLFAARNGGRVEGVAVYRVEDVRDVPVRVGHLVELHGAAEALPRLLRAVFDDARSEQVAMLDFHCASRQYAGVLAEHGFLAQEDAALAQIPVLFQPIDRRRPGIRFMADLRNAPPAAALYEWYVTKSDGDQDRPN